MLNPNTEKRNEEKLIFREEVPVKGTISSPFESGDDLILSGTTSSVNKGEVTFRKRETEFSASKNEGLISILRGNQIENAERDLRRSPNNPYLLNNLGLAYLGSGQLDKAIGLFKQALEAKHDFRVAALNLAFVYIKKNEEEEATDIYKDLLQKYPEDTRVIINLGDIYTKNKKLVEARNIFEGILKKDPNNITAKSRLGVIDLIEFKYTRAISEFRKCLQINSRWPSIYNNLGVAYGLTGSHKKAISSFKIALKLSPNYISAIENLATTLRLKNNLSDAIDLLDNYLRKNEDFRIRELLARFYAESGEHQRSIKLLTVALSNAMKAGFSENEIAKLHNNIAVIYTLMGNLKNAENHYLNCIKITKQLNQVILTNLIDLYFAQYKIGRAKEFINMLHEAFEGESIYFYYLALYNYYTQKLPDAIDNINIFLSTNKKFASAYSLLSFIFSEYLYEYKKAIELNREAMNYLPNNTHVINNLAYNYLMDNDINSARELLEKVKDVTNDVFLTATRGLLRIKEGNVEEGRRLYNLAESLAANEILRKNVSQKKHLELAKYYLANNRDNEASTNLEKVLSIKPRESIYAEQAYELYKKHF
ncbi:MAG: tetratricopeptide repeat protein [Thermodesulfobacteriota bacterium]|jgi:tetratricopeptide (TPR) repeat protein